MRTRTAVQLISLISGMIPSVAFAQVASEFIMLDPCTDNSSACLLSKARVVSRKHGEVDFLEHYTRERAWHFTPFSQQTGDAYTCPDPIGDRLGYDTCGLFDVNGDGFNDWAETWYHAEPKRAINGTARLGVSNVAFVPQMTAQESLESPSPASILNSTGAERVGFVRIISGKDGSQIGNEIWGSDDNTRIAHEIARIGDLDGDGRGEVVLSSNTTDGGRGSINVYSFSERYNTNPSDQTQRWVCILKIIGSAPTSELAYELADIFPDLNGDGVPDIIAASVWWRDNVPAYAARDSADETHRHAERRDRGAAWVFLMPAKEAFQYNQLNGSPLSGNEAVVEPLVLHEEDANLTIHNPVVTPSYRFPLADLDYAGDIDGDGIPDLVANTGYTISSTAETRGEFFFLSHDGYSTTGGSTAGTLWGSLPAYVLNSWLEFEPEGFRRIELTPEMADFAIVGDASHSFEYNTPSVFGREFDYLSGQTPPAAATPTDMVLFASTLHDDTDPAHPEDPRASVRASSVRLILNMATRYSTNAGGFKSDVLAHSPGQPHIYRFDQFPTGADYVIKTNQDSASYASSDPHARVQSFSGHNIVGVNMGGNFNGDGGGDCELLLDTVKSDTNAYHSGANNDYFNRGYCLVVNVPPPTTATTPDPLTALYEIQGESEIVDPTGARNDTDFFAWLDVSPNYQGCIGEPGWDQDGDGRSDVIIRAPFFPALVDHVPTWPNGDNQPYVTVAIPEIDGKKQPYVVDGGADYLVLSPPAMPTVVSVDGPNLGSGNLVSFTLVAHNLVPEAMPFDFWDKDKIFFRNTCGASSGIAASSVTRTRTVTPDALGAITSNTTTMTITFNSATVRSDMTGHRLYKRYIELPTRWKESDHGLCIEIQESPLEEEPIP